MLEGSSSSGPMEIPCLGQVEQMSADKRQLSVGLPKVTLPQFSASRPVSNGFLLDGFLSFHLFSGQIQRLVPFLRAL